MFAVKFVIFGIREDGSELELFRWTRDAQSGITRAIADAKAFGMTFARFEAREAA